MVNTNSVLSSILFSQTIDWNIKQFFSSTSINSSFELKRIGKAITRRKDQMVVEDDKRYKRITIKTNCGGVFVRDEVLGKDIKTKKQYYVSLSRNPVCTQEQTGSRTYMSEKTAKRNEDNRSLHFHAASFFRFMAANLSFTQFVT